MNKLNISVPKSSDWSIKFILPDTINGIDTSTLNPLFLVRDTNSPQGSLLINATNIEVLNGECVVTIPYDISRGITVKTGYYNFILYNTEHEFRMCEGNVLFTETLRQ